MNFEKGSLRNSHLLLVLQSSKKQFLVMIMMNITMIFYEQKLRLQSILLKKIQKIQSG